jgi:hypothetical protein
MGMDVIGKNPKNKKGEYFRNNVWWWRPLWQYCEYVAPELTEKVEYAGSNDGDGLDGNDARKLGNALRSELRKGMTAVYISARQEYLDSLPVRPCAHCEATGTRKWLVNATTNERKPAVTYNFLEAFTNEQTNNGQLPTYEYHTPEEGWVEETTECNGCEGTGGQPAWERSYPLTEENVREFATFLVNCGGFEIW